MAASANSSYKYGFEIGDKVRPRGGHIAESHIGTVIEIVDAHGTCECCGQEKSQVVNVEWSDGRRGIWNHPALVLVEAANVG